MQISHSPPLAHIQKRGSNKTIGGQCSIRPMNHFETTQLGSILKTKKTLKR